MNYTIINGIRVYSFPSRDILIKYAEMENKSLVAINAEKLLHATAETREMINKNIGYADGLGALLALRKKGFKEAVKIPGCELWLDIVRHFYQYKSFYLVGAKEQIVKETTIKLQKEFPGINIVGYRNGYIKTEEEEQQLIQTISEKKPDIVFVAMGSPKQEIFMHRMGQKHQAIYLGLGGSFDVYTGYESAPGLWVGLGLEWAYRWLQNPKTRTKRNLQLIGFFYKLYTQKYY